MNSSIIQYLSLIKDKENGNITLNENNLRQIRTEYENLYNDSDVDLTEDQRKEETLKKLARQLNLHANQMNIDYLNICVSQRTDDDAKLEIIDKFEGPVEYIDLLVITEQDHSQKSPNKKSNDEEDTCQNVNQLTCIIYKNLDQLEVNNFMKTFLFRQVQGDDGQALTQSKIATDESSLIEGVVHPLRKGTILDLFIRQQLSNRGIITFKRLRSKYRLVEPISLTDDFDSWTFDNFQQIFDFWLTIDPHNNTAFPTRWKLQENAVLNYIIGGISDQTNARIQHPSTISLENFIRDICKIEDNGMGKHWYEALIDDEDIVTYAHLSNLTQPEWDRIKKLPMNALKTIKFYVDQEKNLTASRSLTTKNKDKGKLTILHCIAF
jgi:hypothetical protein